MSEAEWQTRKQRIDARLRSLQPAWKIIRYKEGLDLKSLDGVAVEELPTANGPADYALFVKGKLLGIIEAKKVAVNPQNVLEQAKRYAAGVFAGSGNWNGLKVPFLYASNGELIWHLDARPEKRISRRLSQFHSAPALEAAFAFDSKPSCQWLLDTPPEKIERLRPYQRDCIVAAEAAIIGGRRDILLAMATGTGKTFLTVAQVYRLLESKLARRILFLVDRKALAAQAVREFNSFTTPRNSKFTNEYEVYSQKFQKEDFGEDTAFDPKELPNGYLTDPKPSQTFVYVCTIQRLAGQILGPEFAFPQSGSDAEREEDLFQLPIPIHAFDLIIADECHRGYTAQETSIWRDTINHFDAVRIGLTATPAPHTLALFGEPVFRYGLEQAIRDGHLVDYEAVKIKSDVRIQGVFLKPGDQVERIDTETGEPILDEIEDERQFAAEDIERRITAPDSNRKIIREIRNYALEHEDRTGHFPKILIFACNDIAHTSHADQLVRICREEFNYGDEFVQKITGNPNVDRPLEKIRRFRNRPETKIVVTVDMLSTGVDIPALEFIVFLRPVKSRILWEQMIGRGTRKCPDINKTHFTIFDCFDGTLIRYFKEVSNIKIEVPRKDPLSIPEIIENIWQNIDRGYFSNVLVKRLRRIEKDMSAEARDLFAKYIPDGDIGQYAGMLLTLLKNEFTPTMKLLRNPEFQRLLMDYPRAKATFLVSPGTVDNVSSEVVLRFGKFDRADDYLEAFSQFVKENANKVAALGVLLKQPKEWRPAVMEELKQTLSKNGFDPQQLQRAHRAKGFKALADVISIVKHASAAQSPLLTAEERVNRAIDNFVQAHKLTPEQMQWLSLVREHLVKNLSIDEEDFDNQPLLSGRGGTAKARKVFQGEFAKLLQELNCAVAA